MDIKFDLFPEGKTKALTMSYDDGPVFDRRLVEIFNKYGIR
ncbi:MAG: polysaccharide deacetylase, partial [Oscillospiraceae bacterium]|nr:polysaccharide deacetylase [Oscillospiraceae bacterium]